MAKKKISFWAACILVFSLFCGCASAQEKPAAAKDFTLKGLDNSSFTLSAYRDKEPVLLFFFTTWCPFCRKELKALSGRYQQVVKEGIVIAVIDVQESAAKIESFAKSNEFSFPILLDSDGEVAQSYGILGIPTYFLIDKKGIVQFEGNSFPDEEYKRLIAK